MGYIQNATSDIADTSQAVVSLWLKVTQASIDAAVAQYQAIPITSGVPEDGNLPGMIPLLTFGIPAVITDGIPETSSRCFIGLSCGHRYGEDIADELPIPDPRMYVYLQYDSGNINPELTPGAKMADFFQIGGAPVIWGGSLAGRPDGGSITVSAGEWHHILVSFDMSGGCETSIIDDDNPVSFDLPCQFWWAFDDVNYDGDYLWPSNPNAYVGYSGGANDIYSHGCIGIGNGDFEVGAIRNFPAGALPINGNPMGIPASADDVDHVYNVIMAEIQVYTDVTMDTSVEANRRKFISSDGRPVAKATAAAFFGKEPEIYFQTQADANTGNNRGTAGDFTRTGTVDPYTPGP